MAGFSSGSSRRILPRKPRLVGRPWNDVARELQEVTDILLDATDNGIPPGFTNTAPTQIMPGDVANAGTQDLGWSAADHRHRIDTGSPAGLGNVTAQGTSTAFPRLDHIHKRDVRVKQAGADVGTRNGLNVVGPGLTVTDNPGADTVDIGLSTTLKTGFVPLALQDARRISGSDVINLAGTGGILALDSTPKLQRVNLAVQKGWRVIWAAADVTELQWQEYSPPDLDPAQSVVLSLLASMGGNTDTPTVDLRIWDGVTTNVFGGATGAVTGTTPVIYTVTIAGGSFATPVLPWSITVIPGAHGTDILRVDGFWITYTRK